MTQRVAALNSVTWPVPEPALAREDMMESRWVMLARPSLPPQTMEEPRGTSDRSSPWATSCTINIISNIKQMHYHQAGWKLPDAVIHKTIITQHDIRILRGTSIHIYLGFISLTGRNIYFCLDQGHSNPYLCILGVLSYDVGCEGSQQLPTCWCSFTITCRWCSK